MGERKVLNKYIPPDFDPAKIPRKKIGKKKQDNIRNMLSMKIRCNICGHYMGAGTKFNQRKEEAGEKYLGVIQIFRFYFKCSVCCSEITVLTDPKNSDYVVEKGGKRCSEPWRGEDEEKEEVEDYMESLERRSLDSKREMDKLAALHEVKSMNSRRSKISFGSLLDNLRPGEEEEDDKLCAEDEAIIELRFGGGTREFVRRVDDEDDWDESPNRNLKKRKVVSRKSTCNPTDLLSESCVFGSPNSKGTSGRPCSTVISSSAMANIYAVKKKTLNRQEETKKTTIFKENKQEESNNAILCLCKEYGSDEEN